MLSSSHAPSSKQIANLKKFSFNEFLTSYSVGELFGDGTSSYREALFKF